MLKTIENDVKWIPDWGEERIKAMVNSRPDWCLSRQRIWGVPIPVMYCKDCGEPLVNKKNVLFFRDLVKENGVDCWYSKEPKELKKNVALSS